MRTYQKQDFILVEIINTGKIPHDMYDIIVDWDNLCEKEPSEDDAVENYVEEWSDEKKVSSSGDYPGGTYVGLWLDGDKELIREKFQRLQLEPGIEFTEMIYDDTKEQNDHLIRQWTTTLHIVLAMLMIVAGIGLLNSAKGMLLARKKEYQVLRMLGATQGNVHRICWMQVWSYMLSGVVLGAVLGIIVVSGLWKTEIVTNTLIKIEWEYIAGIAIYLLGLSLLLYPSIKKMG